jgi:organic hydroperoxide reductase OsmC/OhrA
MRIVARVRNSADTHTVSVETNGNGKSLTIPPKEAGRGSSANGGELLFLALATCYCNDLFREAAARNITMHVVEVEVDGEFGGPGDPASSISYRARVQSDASPADIDALLVETDRVAEIQNTVRRGCPVQLLM